MKRALTPETEAFHAQCPWRPKVCRCGKCGRCGCPQHALVHAPTIGTHIFISKAPIELPRFEAQPLSNWRTKDEEDFLDRLGHHRMGSEDHRGVERTPQDRLSLLLAYKAVMRHREWGSLDQDRIGKHLDMLIFRSTNGNGDGRVCGGDLPAAQRYAQPAGVYRREIRRGGEDDGDEAA